MRNLLALFLILLFVSTAEAVTWHVNDLTGTDVISCTTATNPASTPKKTIRAGIQCARDNGAPGNTVEIAAGNYNERFESGFIPSGSSGNYFTITNKPGDTVTIKPLSAGGTFEAMISLEGSGTQYVKLLGTPGFGFKLDATNQVNSSIIIGGTGNNIVQGIEFINSNGVNTIFVGGSGNSISQNKIHGGTHAALAGQLGYPIYVDNGPNIIEYNEIYDFPRYGVHVNHSGGSVSNVIVRNNNIHSGLNFPASPDDASAIVCASNCDTGNKFYNNLIWGMVRGHGIVISGNGTQVFNNTVVDSPQTGIYVYPTNSNSVSVRNNLIFNPATSSLLNEGSGTIMDHNRCNSGCTGTGTLNSTADPFVNKAGGDFRITAASGLGSAGADLSAVGGFNTDYAGNPRDVPWSIGAYEYGIISPTAPPRLVLALPLDEGTGTTAADVSGQNNNASFVGGVTWDVSGKYGKAVMLDGTGYLNVPAANSLALAPAMTLEAWIYPTVAFSDFKAVIAQNDYHYYLYAASDTGSCSTPLTPFGGYATADNNIICATSIPALSQWSHLAITHDGTTLTFYLNGSVVASRPSTDPMISSTSNLTLGASIFGEQFIGKIDQPMVYNYARSPTQIVSDMNTPLISGPGKYVEIAAPASVEISSASSIEIAAD